GAARYVVEQESRPDGRQPQSQSLWSSCSPPLDLTLQRRIGAVGYGLANGRVAPSRPQSGPPEQDDERGREERADEEAVDEDPDSHREGHHGERRDRDEREEGEARG